MSSSICKGNAEVEGGGLSVDAWSGPSPKAKSKCKIQGQSGIKHIVQIKSLLTYRSHITCTGTIRQTPASVAFASGRPGDSNEKWTAKCDLPAAGTSLRQPTRICTFEHVELRTLMPDAETSVFTVVSAVWFGSPIKNGEAEAVFTVTG